jgi:bacillithiol biosynthesis cysteine-adding enzyme BshC
MKLQQIHWEQNQALTEDYINNYIRVQKLFEYNPWDEYSLQQRSEYLSKRQNHAPRTAVAEVLERYNQSINNSPASLDMIRRFKEEDALVIVGGQQAGLFGGQLMIVYKAISIIRAAKQAAVQLGKPVIPVFWIAGEDHDLDEVNHVHILSPQLQMEKILLPPGDQQSKRPPISQLPISKEQWEQVLSELDGALQSTEFKPPLMDKIRALCEESQTLTELFARILVTLFGSHGLVLMDSNDPELRRVEAPFFKELIEKNKLLSDALVEGNERVITSGYEPQAEVRETNANLFLIRDDERSLMYRHNEGFSDRTCSFVISRSGLLEIAETKTYELSNNVFTRPLMQDYLFPVLQTVLGPGEIAYWALMKPAFQQFDMQMPIILPRLEFTLIESTVQKQLDKFNLSFEDAIYRLDEKREQWLQTQDSIGLPQLFNHVREKFDELYKPVLHTLAQINTGLQQLGQTNHQKILEQISFLETRSNDAFQAQFDAALRQYDRIRNNLTPLNKRQERVFSVLAYMTKYGETWLEELLATEIEWNGPHYIVYL